MCEKERGSEGQEEEKEVVVDLWEMEAATEEYKWACREVGPTYSC